MKKQSKKKVFGAAVVLLIAIAMMFSSATAIAENNTLTSWTTNVGAPNNLKSSSTNRDPIVWDNGPIDSTSVGLSSQLDLVYPFNSQVADNFQFTEETIITDVHWWGTFWNGPPAGPNPADFNIIFYKDAGGMPTGAGMPDPTPTALLVCFIPQVVGIPTGGVEQYEYNAILPTPFTALANQMYWIAIQWVGNFPPQWGWDTNGNNPELLTPSLQGFPLIGMAYWTAHTYGDMAFYLTGQMAQPPVPDLKCEGTLTWDKIKTGSTIYGEFVVKNIGENGSLLNWEVDSYPTWGTWTFTPDSGTGLAAGDSITVNVTVVAPTEKRKEFTGKVKIVNVDDTADFCEIDVILKTPLSSNLYFPHLLVKLFERFPQMFPLLRQLLGY